MFKQIKGANTTLTTCGSYWKVGKSTGCERTSELL